MNSEPSGTIVLNGQQYKYGIDPTAKVKTGRRETARMVRLFEGQRKGTVGACGHKVQLQSEPSTNCFDCWHRFFSINPKLVYGMFEFLRNGKEAEIREARGKKFLKHFKAFVLHVQSIAPVDAKDAVAVDANV